MSSESSSLPALRLHSANDREIRPDGDYVLYWMIAHRRCHWNFSLQRAVEWCAELGKPPDGVNQLVQGLE